MPQKMNLLVVEDDHDLGEMIVDSLKDLFQRVEFTTNFDTAIKILTALKPDVIVTDQNIDGGFGIAIVAQAKANNVNTVAIVQTGNPSLELQTEAAKLGSVEIIEKPFDAKLLHLRVSQLIMVEDMRRKMEASPGASELRPPLQ
ncbi:response regulator [Bdellovibrio sp. SKB1291214]|uniref:response regulator n=1 Tax=Bdellovibrio sp. SKB1291214 TaxID=1732569 RepID=UPI00159579CD|nr:response regulator [Bdellovibrio sp. SKB1291214]UYL09255.1 response regulator [Bdellovibrio sp. SKB1291214]